MKRCGKCRKPETLTASIIDRIGIDPYDVCLTLLRVESERWEREPVSRFVFGSPCRFVRAIDFVVHRLLPEMLRERYPRMAERLTRTSPRWGHIEIGT